MPFLNSSAQLFQAWTTWNRSFSHSQILSPTLKKCFNRYFPTLPWYFPCLPF